MAQRTGVAPVSGPLTNGKGWPFASPTDVAAHGCVMQEFLVDGVAGSYAPAAGTKIGVDGKWSVEPAETAAYRTRMKIVRPSDPGRFNGTVIVMIATGGSQSAMRLGSYLNIVDDAERFFDGFLLTVHWGMCKHSGTHAINPLAALSGESTPFPDADALRARGRAIAAERR